MDDRWKSFLEQLGKFEERLKKEASRNSSRKEVVNSPTVEGVPMMVHNRKEDFPSQRLDFSTFSDENPRILIEEINPLKQLKCVEVEEQMNDRDVQVGDFVSETLDFYRTSIMEDQSRSLEQKLARRSRILEEISQGFLGHEQGMSSRLNQFLVEFLDEWASEIHQNEVNSFLSCMGFPSLPSFSGVNPVDWINGIEVYFDVYPSMEIYQFSLVEDLLVGRAKEWVESWSFDGNYDDYWDEFVDALCEHFDNEEQLDDVQSSVVEKSCDFEGGNQGSSKEESGLGCDMNEPGYVIESERSFEANLSSRRCVSNGMVVVDIDSEMMLSISSSSLYELTGIMILVYDPGKWMKRIVKLGMDLSVANLNFYAFLQVFAFHIWDPGDLDVTNKVRELCLIVGNILELKSDLWSLLRLINVEFSDECAYFVKEQIQLCCDVASALLECGSLDVFELDNILSDPKARERQPRRFMEAIKHTTKLRHVAKQQQVVLKQFGSGDYGCPDVVITVDLQQQAPVGIDKTFWSMLEHARSLNLKVPLQSADFNALSDRRDNKAIIDHSVQVGLVRSQNAVQANMELEFHRNKERFGFLKWGANACDNMLEVPPSSEIAHQDNLEYLGRVVFNRDGIFCLDSVVGTDSHTTMIDRLKVAGWGVGGIEAKAATLGQPMSMVLPGVVGYKLVRKLRDGVTATDLVLTVTQMLRKHGIVDKFVELYDEDMSKLSLADRATIANMSPEYGATMDFFPVDHVTLKYMKLTVRSEEKLKAGLIGVTWDDWCHFVNVQLVKNLHRYRVAEMVFLSWLYKLFNEKTWKMTLDLVLNQTFSHLRTSVL